MTKDNNRMNDTCMIDVNSDEWDTDEQLISIAIENSIQNSAVSLNYANNNNCSDNKQMCHRRNNKRSKYMQKTENLKINKNKNENKNANKNNNNKTKKINKKIRINHTLIKLWKHALTNNKLQKIARNNIKRITNLKNERTLRQQTYQLMFEKQRTEYVL